MTTTQLPAAAIQTGVTYRQLDYWTRQGYIHAAARSRHSRQGVPRIWSPVELAVAETMGRLVAAGITPATAARVARGETEIGPGIQVVVS